MRMYRRRFATNAAPAATELLQQVDVVVDEDGDESDKPLQYGDYLFAWQLTGEGQLAFPGVQPGRGRFVVGVAGEGALYEDAATDAAAAAAVRANVSGPPTWAVELGEEAEAKVEKYVMESSGGGSMSYDDFQNASLEELFGSKELTAERAAAVLEGWGEDLHDVRAAGTEEDAEDALERWMLDHGKGENTYNWSWWGPTLNFYTIRDPEGSGDAYDSEVYMVRKHRGGDPRGNYGRWQWFKVESAADEAPWYAWSLYVSVKTPRGTASFYAEDTEASRWLVSEDPTGHFRAEQSVKSDDIDKAFGVDIWR